MVVRRHVDYTGRVQGVGFRYAAVGLARGRWVSGWVRNLADGRVEIVVEGQETAVLGFLGALQDRMGAYIRKAEERDEPATGEFEAFDVAYDWG
jgi:acylphosphatase